MHALSSTDVAVMLLAASFAGAVVGFLLGSAFLTWSLEREWQRALREYDTRRATTTAYEFMGERRERFRAARTGGSR